ncbi:MAG TPA: 50S ribosomal protein L5, partial [Myxococcales bacterium]|nr:50S ribosomal protein L5 [Myxococcales bacterium]
MVPRLQQRYRDEIISKLRDEFGYLNSHQVPSVMKVVVNVGIGEATQNSKLLDRAMEELTVITGQKPALRRAKKSVSNFRLREGQGIGAKVTLRGTRMWEFLDRLLTVALPRVRDFGGVSERAFDG